MTRVAAVQPALALGEVEANLARVEELVRDAVREHAPQVVVVPEGCTSPNVFAPELRAVPRPLDGGPLETFRRLARELDVVLAGGFLAVRGAHAHGTFVLVEPDGTTHHHDKDVPTAWEQAFYRGGSDAGVVRSEALGGVPVGLMSGWEWARGRTARRVLDGGAQLVLGGMCWPSFPTNWRGPLRRLCEAEHALWLRQCHQLPGQVARRTGVAVVHAAHVGPVTGRTPMAPGLRWPTTMLGETQVCERDGTVLARLTVDDGEGHVAADVRIAPPEPAEPVGDGFWIPELSLLSHAAWHGMNAHGALTYRLRHRRGQFPWQAGGRAAA